MSLNFRLVVKNVTLRSLSVGVFLLLSMAGLSSSSGADEPLFVRSAQQLERLWSGVLGCTHPKEDDTRPTFETTLEGTGAPSVVNHDYAECGKRALRGTSSRMLVDTIEDAVRSGGIALFDQDFRLHSNIGWIWGESVTGDLDAVIPVPLIEDRGPGGVEHALFLQPGLVFWPGLNDERRVDGNFGVVYRARLADNIVAGSSLFYDYDFQNGSRRFGIGIDLQSHVLQAGLNYYHPLSEWRAGRTDYEERALQGGDFRLGLAWSRVQFGANVGVWRFEGAEDEKTKWRPSFGVDGGIRIFPGVFLKAGYERHDEDDSLGSRWNAGLAFRFSLPGLDGEVAPLDSVSRPDLFEPVVREKRILYEEQLNFALLLEVENAFIVEPGSRGSGPTSTKVVGVISGRGLRQDETLEVVLQESTTAEHGVGYDFTLSQEIYGTNVRTGEQITPTGSAVCATSPCRMEIPAGVMAEKIEVEVSALTDGEEREFPEFIDMRIDVRDGSSNLVHSSNIVRITIGAHGNTVGFASSSDAELGEDGGEAEVTVEIALPLQVPVALRVETSGEAVHGTDYRMPTVLAIPAGADSATLALTGIDNEQSEGDKSITLTLSGDLPDGWGYAADEYTLTLLEDDLNMGFAASTDAVNPTFVYEDVGHVTLTVAPNQPLPAGADVGWSVTAGNADLGGSTSGSLSFDSGSGRNDPQTITLAVDDDGIAENAEQVTVVLIDNNLPEGWSLGDDTHTFTIEPSDGTVEFASSDAVTADEGDTLTFEITSDIVAPSAGIPVRVTPQGNAAEDIRVEREIRIPAGQDGYSLAVEIIDDGAGEEAEEHTFGIDAGGDFPSGWGKVLATTRTVPISANDNIITFSAPSSASIAEEGGTATITATINLPIPADETASIAITPGGEAVKGAGYELSASGGTLSRNTWTLPTQTGTATLTVTAKDTPAVSSDTLLTLGFAGATLPEGWSVAAVTHSINIEDDDAPGKNRIGFSETRLEVTEAESDTDITYHGKLTDSFGQLTSIPADTNFAVELALESGGASDVSYSGRTYTINSGITLDAQGVTTNPLDTFTVRGDTTAELEEIVTIVMRPGADFPSDSWEITPNKLEVVIAPNDNKVGFASRNATVAEDAGRHEVVVEVGVPYPDGSITLNVEESGSAVIGDDYNVSPSVTVAAGSSAANISVEVIDDLDFLEGSETVVLTIKAAGELPTGWSIDEDEFTLTITDNDQPPSGTVGFASNNPIAVTEGGSVPLRITSTVALLEAVVFNWQVVDSDDDGDVDVSPDQGTVTISANRTSGMFEVSVAQDQRAEADEQITVMLTDPNAVDLFTLDETARTHILTIAAEDNTIAFDSASDSSILEEGATSATVTLNIDAPIPFSHAGAVTIDVGRVGSANEGGDYTIEGTGYSEGVLTLPKGQTKATLTVKAVDDDDYDPGESFMLSLSNLAGAPDGWDIGSQKTHAINLTDNNLTGTFFFSETGNVTEADEGTPVTLTVKASQTVDTAVPVEWLLLPTNEVLPPVGGKIEIARGTDTATLTFTVADDNIAEEAEEVHVRLFDADTSDGWTPAAEEIHTLTVPANGNTLKFADDTPISVSEPAADTTSSVNIKIVSDNNVPVDGLELTLTITGASEGEVSFSNDPDATESIHTFTIEGGEAESEVIPLHFHPDLDAESETVTLALTASNPSTFPTVWGVLPGATHEIKITEPDDTSGSIGFAAAGSDVTEPGDGETVEHTINIKVAGNLPDSAFHVTVNATGSAQASADYNVSPALTSDIRIARDSVSNGVLPLTFTINGDDIPEDVEDIVLSLPEEQTRIAEGWTLEGEKAHTIRIKANGNTIGFATLDSYRIEEGGSIDIVVAIDSPLPVDGSLGLSIEGGDDIDVTPLEGSTYSGGILGFSSGAGSAGIRATARDDSDIESAVERVTFTLSVNPVAPLPDGWKITHRYTRAFNIEPSDNTISLAVLADDRIEEGESVDIIVEVNHPLPADRSVLLNIDDDSGIDVVALEGSVYNNGILRLDADAQSSGIRVTAKQDPDAEIAQEVTFTLSERGTVPLPTGWNIGDRERVITIEPSDNTISLAAPLLSTITEGAAVANKTTVTATIDKQIPAGLSATIAVMPADGSEAQSSDYTLSVSDVGQGSVNGNIWTLPTETSSATLTITAVDNSVDAPDKILTLGFVADSLPTGWIVSGGASHDITIADDDLTGTFQFAENQDAEAEEGDTVTLTVVTNETTEVDVPVTWTVTSGSEDVTDPDSGTVTIPKGGDSATFDIEITDEGIAEYANTVTVTLSDAANRSDLWTPHGVTEHIINVPANDNTIRIETPSSASIAESGGVATITAAIDLPIPVDEPGETTVRIRRSEPVVRGDLSHFDENEPDYTLSVPEGNGSFVVSSVRNKDRSRDGIWTLPKGVERATLTVTAIDDIFTVSSEDSFADMPDKEFHLGFFEDDLPEGWSVPAGTSHDITLLDDALPDAQRNIIGIETGTANNMVTLREGGTASFDLKLTNADGTAYRGAIPEHFIWQYTPTGADNSGGQDFSVALDEGGNTSLHYWYEPVRADARTTFAIEEGKSYSDGLVPLTITAANDAATEGMETFHYRIHGLRSTAPEDWKVDSAADILTVVILASDNSIEFAQPSSEDVPEDGGSTFITLSITDPIEPGETVTVDLGVTGAVEGTDFAIADGTATYSNGTLTLPTEADEATFILRAVDNPADDEDRMLKLTLSNLTSALGDWGGLGKQAAHDVRITGNTKNTIGFTSDAITVAEDVGTVTSLMLQLSTPEGRPYTGTVPANFSLAYSSIGTNENDFSVRINDTGQGSSLGTQGTVPISGRSYNNGQIPVTITLIDDEVDEGVEEFVYTLANPSSSSQFPSDTWTVAHFADKFTLTILASDSSVEFVQDSSQDISENGGRARIILNLSNPIPDGETVTVDLGIRGATVTIIDGTATYSGGKLTLPTDVTEADFTIEAQNNNTSALDKTLTLTLSNLSGGPDDWGALGDRTSHTVTVVDDDKSTIGFTQASRRIAVDEDVGTASAMLQFSHADGTPYTGTIPANLSLAYSSTGTNDNDFSIVINSTETGTALGTTGSLEIPQGQSFANGQIPITITVTEDDVPENVEEFVYTIESSPPPFPVESWQIAPGADSLTLIITDNDNTISFVTSQVLEESANNLKIPVTLSTYAALNITFNVAMTARDQRSGRTSPVERDISSYARTITFNANSADEDVSAPGHQQTVEIDIEPVRGDGPENREIFWVSLTPISPLPPGFVFPSPFAPGTNPKSRVIGYTTPTFSIPAHDNTINFAENQPTTVAEGESITIELVFDSPVPGHMVFDITSDADEAADITITPDSVTIDGNRVAREAILGASFSVTANSDDDAVNETITLTPVFNTRHFQQLEGWEIPEATKHTFTIEDDESATVLFDPTNKTRLLEAEGEVTLRVNFENGNVPTDGVGLSLSSSDPGRVRIPEESSSFTAEEGVDSFTFMVDVLADDNGDEDTVTLTLRKGTDGNGAGFPAEWELKDDAEELTLELDIVDRGAIGFARPGDTFDEPDSISATHAAPLALSAIPDEDIILAFHVTLDGAVDNRNTGDFFLDTLYTVRVADVSNGMADFPIFILPDDEYEEDEGFTLTLSEDQPDLPHDEWYIDRDNDSYTVIIAENDFPGGNTLGFAIPLTAVKEQTETIQIEVVSSAPAPAGGLPLKVTLDKSAGSRAAFTDDASAATRDLMIEPRQSSASFSVSIFDDATEAADEEVTLTLSFGENFPHEWGTEYVHATISKSKHVIRVDDRDDGRVYFGKRVVSWPEPYPGEPVSDFQDCKYYDMPVTVTEVPRSSFNLTFASEAVPYVARDAFHTGESCLPLDGHEVTPEDAADGVINVPVGVSRDTQEESTEYWTLRILEDNFPQGFTIGNPDRIEIQIEDSHGGQVGFAPNDTLRDGTIHNPSVIKEGTSVKIAVSGQDHDEHSPMWLRLEGGTGSSRDNDIGFHDYIFWFLRYRPPDDTFQTDDLRILKDNEREDDKTYTLVLSEAEGFPREHGRRVDPARSRYTFTVPASGGTVDFAPGSNTTLTEGAGAVLLSLVLEGGEPSQDGVRLSLSSSNPDIIGIPDLYRNFTIPEGYSPANYPFSVDVKTDGNATNDTATLTLRKGMDGNGVGFPEDWEFRGDAEELTMDLAVIDTSSSPPSGTIQFLNAGATEFEPKNDPVSGAGNRKRVSVFLQITAPPLVAFDLPIEVSGSASFGVPDRTCAVKCLDGTYDVTRNHLNENNPILPLESPDDDTIFARIQPDANGTIALEFQINDDIHFEEAETFILTIPEDASLPTGFTLGDRRRFILTIHGNDNTVEFASGESSVTEGGAYASVTLSINKPLLPETSASVLMRIESVDGASGNDYTLSNFTGGSFDADTNTFAIPAGVDSVTFNVTANEDTLAESDESVTFTLDANGSSFPEGWGGIGSQDSHIVAIKDNEITGIGFADAAVDPTSENGKVSLQVNVPGDIGRHPARFAWTVSPAEDVENPTGMVSLIDRNYSLEINIKDDDAAELAEEVTVTLIDPDPSDIWTIDGRNATRTFTIPASDNTVTFLAPSPATVSENGGSADITAFITHPAPSGEAPVITITPSGDAGRGDYNFSVAEGNGSISSDNATWTLPTEADSATLTVTAVDNSDDDIGSKTLTLGFTDAASMPAGWSISGSASLAIAIADDDDVASTGTVQFAHASSSATEGEENTILQVPVLVTGTPATAIDLKVNVMDNSGGDDAATQGGEDVEGGDFTVPATLNLSRSGSTNLEVTILADTVAEFAETFVLEIPSENNGLPEGGSFSLGETVQHTVTIAINDNFVGFAATESLVLESVPGGMVNVPVSVNSPAPSLIAFNVSATSTTAVEGEDYSLLTSFLTIDAGEQTESIEVSIVNDDGLETNEDIILTISTLGALPLPHGWSLGTTSHTLTIESEDRVISFAEAFSHSAKEGGDPVEATIQITPPLARGVVVPLSVRVEGRASYGYDVSHPASASVASNWVRFAPEEDPEFVNLQFRAINDRDGDSGTVTISLDGERLPAGYTIGGHPTWTINVVDNDTRAVILNDTFTSLREGNTRDFKVEVSPPLELGDTVDIALEVHGELTYPEIRSSHRYFPTSGETDSYSMTVRPHGTPYEGRHRLDYVASPCPNPRDGIGPFPIRNCPYAYQRKPQPMAEGFSAVHKSVVNIGYSLIEDNLRNLVFIRLRALQDVDTADDKLVISLKEDEIPDGFYIPDDAVRTFTVNLIDNERPAVYLWARGGDPADIDDSGLVVVHARTGDTVRMRVQAYPPTGIHIGYWSRDEFLENFLTWKFDNPLPPDVYGQDRQGKKVSLDADWNDVSWGTVRRSSHIYDVDVEFSSAGTHILRIDDWPDGMERGAPQGVKVIVTE